jgi:hypothetical protein
MRKAAVRGGCSKLIPPPATLHPARNTDLESRARRHRVLDKNAIWQHADHVLHHQDMQIRNRQIGAHMKLATGLLAAVLMLLGMGTSHAIVRIADDRGGRIGTYVDKYQDLRSSGEMVVIDGLCASACTIVLGAVPRDRICVTSNANLGFHAAWDYGANGRTVTNAEATQMLYSMYPTQVRRWISARGGLKPHMIFLHGRQLAGMYKPCYMNAQASAQR